MFPTTSTRLSTAMAKSTLTNNSRLTNLSTNFIQAWRLAQIDEWRAARRADPTFDLQPSRLK
jgi:hypothetical protein